MNPRHGKYDDAILDCMPIDRFNLSDLGITSRLHQDERSLHLYVAPPYKRSAYKWVMTVRCIQYMKLIQSTSSHLFCGGRGLRGWKERGPSAVGSITPGPPQNIPTRASAEMA